MRQWRQEWVNVQPPQQAEATQKSDIWDVELPWGMPKDAGLLPQHSQDLLRAARSGVLYKRPAPTEDEEENTDAVAEKPEKKEDETATKGFQIKVWKQINRNSEGSSVSHLAKRRKGTVTISSKTVASIPVGATVTRATVRRVDAAGNPYTQEITLQDGQQVEGEIISTTVVPVSAVDPAQAPPQRVRRPPPPKKKNKPGPGRGRKKKTLPLPAPAPVDGVAPPVEGAPILSKVEGAEGTENVSRPVFQKEGLSLTVSQGIKQEREDSNNPGSEMADNDDDEGDDDGEDGDDGDDGDEEQREGTNTDSQDQDMTDASPTVPTPIVETYRGEWTEPESPLAKMGAPPANAINLAPSLPPIHLANSSPKGSPLKNVVLPSPTEASPQILPIAEVLAPTAPAPLPAPAVSDVPVPAAPAPTDEQQQEDVDMADHSEPAPASAPLPAPEAPVENSEPTVPEHLPLDTVSETANETFIPPAEKVGDIVSPMAETRSTFSMATTAETEGSGSRIESADQTIASNDAPQEDSMPLDIPEMSEVSEVLQASENSQTNEVDKAAEPEPGVEALSAPIIEEKPAPVVQEDSEMKDERAPAPPTTTEESPAPTTEAHTSELVVEDVQAAPAAPAEPVQSPIKSPVKSPLQSPVKSPELAPAVLTETPVEAPVMEPPTEAPIEASAPAPMEPPVELAAPVEEIPVDIRVEPHFEAVPAEVSVPVEAPPAPVEPPVETVLEPPTVLLAQIPPAESAANPPGPAEVPPVPTDDGPDLLAGLETELDRQAELSKSPLPAPPAAPRPEPAELPHVEKPVALPEVPPIEPEKRAEVAREDPNSQSNEVAPDAAPAPAQEPADPAADEAPANEATATTEGAPTEETEKKPDTASDAPAAGA